MRNSAVHRPAESHTQQLISATDGRDRPTVQHCPLNHPNGQKPETAARAGGQTHPIHRRENVLAPTHHSKISPQTPTRTSRQFPGTSRMAHLQPVAVAQTSSSPAGCTAMLRGASPAPPSPSTALACKRKTDSEVKLSRHGARQTNRGRGGGGGAGWAPLPHQGLGGEGALLGVEAEHLERGRGAGRPRPAVRREHPRHRRRRLLLPAPDPRRARHLPASRRRSLAAAAAAAGHGWRLWWLPRAAGFREFSEGFARGGSPRVEFEASRIERWCLRRGKRGGGDQTASENDDQIIWGVFSWGLRVGPTAYSFVIR